MVQRTPNQGRRGSGKTIDSLRNGLLRQKIKLESMTRNIPDQEHAELRFLSYLEKKPATSPLHLTMFVVSFKVKNEFPSSLTEPYITSLSKAIKNPVGCYDVRLDDFSFLRMCN